MGNEMGTRVSTIAWSALGLVAVILITVVLNHLVYYLLEFRDNTLNRHDWLDFVGRVVLAPAVAGYAGIAAVATFLQRASLRFVFWGFIALFIVAVAVSLVLSIGQELTTADIVRLTGYLPGCVALFIGAYIAYRNHRPSSGSTE